MALRSVQGFAIKTLSRTFGERPHAVVILLGLDPIIRVFSGRTGL